MLFSSPVFLFFFLPLVILGYRLLGKRCRIGFLLLASLFFYAWGEPDYLWIMLLSIACNYAFGMFLHAVRDSGAFTRKAVLTAAVAGNLGILFHYKYLNFAITTLNDFVDAGIAPRDIVMPIGISFFTFQGMSYVIDLYFRNVRVQKNPAYIAFYISFFPQLIAGPIVRYITIEDQIAGRTESPEKFMEGAQRFIIGLSKKVLIANTVGWTADLAFSHPAVENTPATAWVGILCYSFQIFFDFAGYSDMAIGLGKIFGFDFLENFNYPYIAKSVTEFWRRWHISLSTWFKDYLYIPIGGNRTGNVYLHLFIVFLATGFWHGASFNFIVWGLWHGLFLIIERSLGTAKNESGLPAPLRWLLTMLVVVVGWVFFRADTLGEAIDYIGVLFGLVQPRNVQFTLWYYLTTKTCLALVIAAAASLPLSKSRFMEAVKQHTAWRFAPLASLALLLLSAAFVVSSTYNPFIYFRF